MTDGSHSSQSELRWAKSTKAECRSNKWPRSEMATTDHGSLELWRRWRELMLHHKKAWRRTEVTKHLGDTESAALQSVDKNEACNPRDLAAAVAAEMQVLEAAAAASS
eukprot:TRINITY_DN27055_c0_g1_i1.p1 TRINITY_DN27055_c0_g1~~TRINITY_DN27055_c0_g1_i1.p1  ORF type:complete len:108 (-),score=25.27 TRINITY_DN27055_c0_g1_i1:425-748(-)